MRPREASNNTFDAVIDEPRMIEDHFRSNDFYHRACTYDVLPSSKFPTYLLKYKYQYLPLYVVDNK